MTDYFIYCAGALGFSYVFFKLAKWAVNNLVTPDPRDSSPVRHP